MMERRIDRPSPIPFDFVREQRVEDAIDIVRGDALAMGTAGAWAKSSRSENGGRTCRIRRPRILAAASESSAGFGIGKNSAAS